MTYLKLGRETSRETSVPYEQATCHSAHAPYAAVVIWSRGLIVYTV